MTPADARPLRADAARNRQRLLDIAVQSFSHDGPDVTLESVARQAGVGIGTLYRHFPTREALIEAAYRSELSRLCEGIDELLDAAPADQALRAWLDRFVDYLATKRGMAQALQTVIASGTDPFAQSRSSLFAAINALLSAGAADGTLRAGVDPLDVITAVNGVAMVTGATDQREQAGRLLDLIVDGLRYRPSS